MATESTNPAFSRMANHLRQAAESLAQAAGVAARDLYFPDLNFAHAQRHLRAMAKTVADGNLLTAYRRHNSLTYAPAHPKNAVRARAGKVQSERKTIAARRNGGKGGRSTSQLKQDAARQNGKKGGRPRLHPLRRAA